MRVYIPATMPRLRQMRDSGTAGNAPLAAYAVTGSLREWYAEGDTEALEYAALTDAARASLRLLNADENAPPRRVVLAADVPDDAVKVDVDSGRAAVVVVVSIPLEMVAAVHVDDIEAAEDVRAAAAAVAGADDGDPDAAFIVDTAEAHELLWYATQEISDLLG